MVVFNNRKGILEDLTNTVIETLKGYIHNHRDQTKPKLNQNSNHKD